MARFLRNWTLERTIVTGFAAALAMLCAVSIISIRNTRSLVSQNQLEGAAFDVEERACWIALWVNDFVLLVGASNGTLGRVGEAA